MKTSQTSRILFLCCAVLSEFSVEAFSAADPSSRREWLGKASAGGIASVLASVATTTATVGFPQMASASTSEYLTELETSFSKLQPIPKMLEEQKWDEVRTILKTPPVNKLWNLGDSQNTVLKLVKETGNVELFEIKDDLAYNLQMCDQLTYDNNFIYYQPGNGKLKIKEPIDAVNKALSQLDTIIKESS
mmetsp:Transcript_9578/g.20105  ORF Transcript_9578/g.20105 Transcript_9578/m.20105 type:complete len:190 (-) Transcript_9578:1695-2264(-)